MYSLIISQSNNKETKIHTNYSKKNSKIAHFCVYLCALLALRRTTFLPQKMFLFLPLNFDSIAFRSQFCIIKENFVGLMFDEWIFIVF